MASAARNDFERRARLASASSCFIVLLSIRTESIEVICAGLCRNVHNIARTRRPGAVSSLGMHVVSQEAMGRRTATRSAKPRYRATMRATSVGLAVAGPVREQPRPSHPTAQSPRGGDTPGVLGEKRLSRLTPPRPAGRGPQCGSRVGVPRRPRSRPPARG
jgi:hypothetical protein